MDKREYGKLYYQENKARIVAKRKEKYHNNSEFRKQCKECQARYDSSVKGKKQRFKNSVRRVRWVADYKAKQGCLICGEDCPTCLGFHHYNDDKEEAVSQLAARGMARELVQQEIEKCIVLCHNCHSKVHAGLIYFA